MRTMRIEIRWIAAAIALLGAGAAGGYWWAHRSMDQATAERASSGRKILYWHDPMVPNAKFDKPGKSPFMDMQLVPVYADEVANDSGGVRVSPNVVQNLGIRLAKVERASLGTRLNAVGNVAFDERRLEVVQSRVEGYVTRLKVRAPLERVRRGQALAEVVAPQWVEAEQEYLALLDAKSERAQAMRGAARERLRLLGVPEATIRAVETTRSTSANATIVAPIDGVVTELGVREGATFAAGSSLFHVNGLATVWVNAQIPEAKVSSVPLGSTVEVHATAWPGESFSGRVIALLPEVDAVTRTMTARVALDNPGFKLSPGMFVSVSFASSLEREPQLVVPSEAVIATGQRDVVIAAREDGSFDVREVSVGAEQDGRTAILSGLTEGESIVSSGQFLIDSEASLKSTLNRLQAPAAPDGAAGAQGTVPESQESRP